MPILVSHFERDDGRVIAKRLRLIVICLSGKDCAMAGKITIAEAEQIVEAGELDPNEIHLPGVYVNKVILATDNEKPIERMKIQDKNAGGVVKGGRGRIMRRVSTLFCTC